MDIFWNHTIWFSPGVPSVRKVINTFIYSKHDALRSTKQGSCITEATLIEIGVYQTSG